jgi:hypothetical protein
MIGDLIAGLIGKESGDGSVGGALEGVVVYEVAKRVVPLARVAGGIWFGAKYVRSKLKDTPAA